MYKGLRVKYLLFLSDYNETLIFSTNFLKNTEISNLMKIRPVRAEMFHADRQTEMTRPTVAFRTFTSGPNKNRECLAAGKKFASA